MNNKNNRGGFTMGLVMSIIVLLAVLGVGLYQLSASSRIGAIRRSQAIAAKCAADAGLVKAVSDIAYDYEQGTLDLSDLPQVSANLENCNSEFDYTVYQNAQGDILVDSTGSSGPTGRTVHCRVDVKSKIFEHSVFANKFVGRNNSFIDGYDSDLGSYGGMNSMNITSIGTNSISAKAIDLPTVMDVYSDIEVGPGGDPDVVVNKGKNVNIYGSSSAAPEEKNVDIIYPTTTLPSRGSDPSGTLTENGKYDKLELNNNEILTIDGNVILEITGDVKLKNNSQIDINAGSSLELYVKGNFTVINGAIINGTTKKPPLCKIFSTAEGSVEYNLKNNGDFYGALYAPNAIVNLSPNGHIYGSIVCDQLYFKNNATIHGDRALLNGTYGEPGTTLVKGKWWE